MFVCLEAERECCVCVCVCVAAACGNRAAGHSGTAVNRWALVGGRGPKLQYVHEQRACFVRSIDRMKTSRANETKGACQSQAATTGLLMKETPVFIMATLQNGHYHRMFPLWLVLK